MEFMNFIKNLKWMGIGMLGVFMIIGIIMAATYLTNFSVNRITAKIKDRKSTEADNIDNNN